MSSYPLLLPKYDGPETTSTYSTAYHHSVVEWTTAAFDEAEYDQQQVEELQMCQGYIDYLECKQWTANRPKSKSRPVDNRMTGLYWELIGQLTDIRPVIEIHGTQIDPDPAYKRATDMLNQGLRAWALQTDFDLKLAKCVAWAILTTSFVKMQWNPFLNYGKGDLEMVPLGPTSVMPLKSKGDLESAEAVIFRDVWSLRQFRAAYPGPGATVAPDERYSNFNIAPTPPSNVAPMIYNLMAEGLKRKLGGHSRSQSSAVPMAEMKEFWLKDETRNETKFDIQIGESEKNWSYIVPPGKKLYPRGRLIVMGGPNNVVLWDGPNPYWHGKPPFAMLRLNVVPWKLYGLCYSSDTEVLTKRGWLKFSETNADDEFATRQIRTGVFEWQKATSFTNEQYSGGMYQFKSRSVDLLVTPNHKMLIQSLPTSLGGKKAQDKGEVAISAEDCYLHGPKRGVQIPQTSTWVGEEIGEMRFAGDVEARTEAMVSKANRVGKRGMTKKQAAILAEQMGIPVVMTGDQYCAFMGMFLSEGWTHETGVYISQRKHSKGFKPFQKTLTEIIGRDVSYDGIDFRVTRRPLRDWCRQFGKCQEKFIPENIMNASPKQLKIFLDYFVLGDGSIKKRANKVRRVPKGEECRITISTTSKKLADQLMELVQKVGWSASIAFHDGSEITRIFPGRDKPSKVSDFYTLCIRYTRTMKASVSKTQYTGTIHCVTVPNGFLYVRRNGKPSWSGNSDLKTQVGLQDIINNILAGVLDAVKRAVNPAFFAPKNAFSTEVWQSLDFSLPNARAAYSPQSAHEPKFVPPPVLPGFVLAIYQEIGRRLEATSTGAVASEAAKKKQIPAAEGIEQLKAEKQTPIRLKGRNIESFMKVAGGMQVSNMIQFWDAKRRMRMLGTKGLTSEDFDWEPGTMRPAGVTGEEYVQRFQFYIEPGSLLSIKRVEERMEALMLRKMHAIDLKTMYKKLGGNYDVAEIEKNLIEEAKIQGALAPPKGKGAKAAA